MSSRRRTSGIDYDPTTLKRLGVPNDQYGVPAHEAPPIYGGRLTAPHNWDEFNDAFATRRIPRPVSLAGPAFNPAVLPESPVSPSGTPRLLARPAEDNKPTTTFDTGSAMRITPAGITAQVDSRSGPREVAVTPDAHMATTLLTGVDPYSVSMSQRTANLRAAVGREPVSRSPAETPLSPQDAYASVSKYRELGTPAMTRSAADPNVANVYYDPKAAQDAFTRSTYTPPSAPEPVQQMPAAPVVAVAPTPAPAPTPRSPIDDEELRRKTAVAY
jgi:hypothetical protein